MLALTAALRCGRGGDRRVGAGRHRGGERLRQRHLRRRHVADEALVARRHVVQVGALHAQVRFGQRDARGGLLEVDAAADAGLDARLDLPEQIAVLHVVVLGELHQLAVAQHVVPGARDLERGLLARIDELEIARQLLVAEAADLALRGQAVPQQLRRAHRGAVIGEAVGRRHARIDLVVDVAEARLQIDARQEGAACRVDRVRRGAEGVEARRHVGIGEQRLLRRAAERVGGLCAGGGGNDEQRRGADAGDSGRHVLCFRF